MRRIFGFMIGILVGWLVGSTIALLLAPETGERLRGQIRQRGTGFVDEIRSAARARRQDLEQHLSALREPQKPAPQATQQ